VTSAAFVGDTGLIAVAGDTTATLWNASGPIAELPGARLPGAPSVGYGLVGSRGARQRVSRIAVAPDGSWLAFGHEAIEIVPLSREERTAAAITAAVEAHGAWRIQGGALVPAPDAAPLAGTRAVAKIYDYSEEIVEGVLRRPAAGLDDPAYLRAWQQHDAGDDASAYRTLLPLADRPGVRAEALRFGASTAIPAGELVAALHVSRGELAAAYDALGDYAREATVLREVVGDGEPAAHLVLARLALADGNPKEATTQLLAALALVDAGAPGAQAVIDQVREQGIAMAAAYSKSLDERYLLAARRVFTAYLAGPRDEGGHAQVVQVQSHLVQQISVGARATGFDKRIIREQIHARSAAAAHCFELGLAHDPKLAGRVTIHARIVGNRISELSTSGPPALTGVASCVNDVMRAIALPETTGTIELDYPIVFHAVRD